MWTKIINPKTGRYVKVNGTIGKQILRNYLLFLKGGSNEKTKKKKSILTGGAAAATTRQITKNITIGKKSKAAQRYLDSLKQQHSKTQRAIGFDEGASVRDIRRKYIKSQSKTQLFNQQKQAKTISHLFHNVQIDPKQIIMEKIKISDLTKIPDTLNSRIAELGDQYKLVHLKHKPTELNELLLLNDRQINSRDKAIVATIIDDKYFLFQHFKKDFKDQFFNGDPQITIDHIISNDNLSLSRVMELSQSKGLGNFFVQLTKSGITTINFLMNEEQIKLLRADSIGFIKSTVVNLENLESKSLKERLQEFIKSKNITSAVLLEESELTKLTNDTLATLADKIGNKYCTSFYDLKEEEDNIYLCRDDEFDYENDESNNFGIYAMFQLSPSDISHTIENIIPKNNDYVLRMIISDFSGTTATTSEEALHGKRSVLLKRMSEIKIEDDPTEIYADNFYIKIKEIHISSGSTLSSYLMDDDSLNWTEVVTMFRGQIFVEWTSENEKSGRVLLSDDDHLKKYFNQETDAKLPSHDQITHFYIFDGNMNFKYEFELSESKNITEFANKLIKNHGQFIIKRRAEINRRTELEKKKQEEDDDDYSYSDDEFDELESESNPEPVVWHKKLNKDTQKYYYNEEAGKTTQWEEPTGNVVIKRVWYKFYDSKQNKYYYNEQGTMKTGWDEPTGDVVIKRVWYKLYDPIKNIYYYKKQGTMETEWDKPPGDVHIIDKSKSKSKSKPQLNSNGQI